MRSGCSNEAEVEESPGGWSRGCTAAAVALLLACGVVLSAAMAHYGDVNTDEGIYLTVSNRVVQGQLPYRDFAYNQPPLLPLVYAASQLGGPSLLHARFTSVGLIGLLILTLILLGRQLGGWETGLAAGALLIAHLQVLEVYVLVDSKSVLVALLACASVAAATSELAPRPRWALALFLGTAAGAAKISGGLVVPLLWAYAVFWDPVGPANRLRRAALYGGFVLLSLLVLFGPFVLLAPEKAPWFWLCFHLERLYRPSVAPQWSHIVNLRGQLRLVPMIAAAAPIALAVVAVLAGGVVARAMCGREGRAEMARLYRRHLLVAAAGAVPAVVTWALLPGYRIYYAWLAPFALALAAYGLTALARACRVPSLVVVGAVAAVTLIAQCDQLQSIHLPSHSRIRDAQAIGSYVHGQVPSGRPVVALSALPCVMEGRLELWPGLEMGTSSVWLDWPAERARRYHMVNPSMLEECFRQREAGAVLLAEKDVYLLAIPASVLAALEEEYRPVRTFPGFAWGPVTVYVPRGRSEDRSTVAGGRAALTEAAARLYNPPLTGRGAFRPGRILATA